MTINPEVPFLDGKGELATPSVLSQIDARTKATMRADLPALAKELKIGGVDGSVPIFPTLAEAQAWEAKNPGKKALTLESSTPDTTAPSAGVLGVTVSDKSATLTVTQATDDRAVTGYAFQVNGGSWSAWQSEVTYKAMGLTPSTPYQFRHKVKDAAGNEATGTAVSMSTTAVPPIQAGDVITSDAFTMFADGTDLAGQYTDATLGGSAFKYGGAAGYAVANGGAAKFVKGAADACMLTVSRLDREVTFTVKALPSSGECRFWIRKYSGGAAAFFITPTGSVGVVFSGPAGGPLTPRGLPAGSVTVGSKMTVGAKGDTGYVITQGGRLDFPSLNGNIGTELGFLSAPDFSFDDLVVKAL